MAGKQPGNGSSSPFGNGSGGSGGGRAVPFNQHAQSNPQKPVANVEIDTASMPAGGPMLYADAQRGSPSAADVGAGSLGGGKPPFRLKGA